MTIVHVCSAMGPREAWWDWSRRRPPAAGLAGALALRECLRDGPDAIVLATDTPSRDVLRSAGVRVHGVLHTPMGRVGGVARRVRAHVSEMGVRTAGVVAWGGACAEVARDCSAWTNAWWVDCVRGMLAAPDGRELATLSAGLAPDRACDASGATRERARAAMGIVKGDRVLGLFADAGTPGDAQVLLRAAAIVTVAGIPVHLVLSEDAAFLDHALSAAREGAYVRGLTVLRRAHAARIADASDVVLIGAGAGSAGLGAVLLAQFAARRGAAPILSEGVARGLGLGPGAGCDGDAPTALARVAVRLLEDAQQAHAQREAVLAAGLAGGLLGDSLHRGLCLHGAGAPPHGANNPS